MILRHERAGLINVQCRDEWRRWRMGES